MFKDPVCNMTIDEKTAKHSSEYNGKKIFFCSENCKKEFVDNPKSMVTECTTPSLTFS